MAEQRREYTPIGKVETEGRSRLDITWDLLISNMKWVQNNADYWAEGKRVTITSLVDSQTKTADQMIDVIKEEAGASGLSVEDLAKLMSGDYQPADEDQEQD